MPRDRATCKKLTIRLPPRPNPPGGSIRPDVRAGTSETDSARDTACPRAADSMDVDVSQPIGVLPVEKTYCCFCGDLAQKLNICNDCGAYMCEQTVRYGNGCIGYGTAPPPSEFLCLLCDGRRWRGLPEDQKANGAPKYSFIGYSGRKRAKLTWPLVLLNMTLNTSVETLLLDALKVDFTFHYLAAPRNLRLIDIALKANGQTKSWNHSIDGGAQFIAHSIRSEIPANCFVVIDTHADTHTGGLQWAGGKTAPKVAPASKVISEFCGQKLMDEMKNASNFARNSVLPKNSEWYETSPYLRGGWRGLFVASCSPAVRVPTAFDDLQRLVKTDVFDFIMAFGGCSTLSPFIRGAISLAIESIGVDKTANIWETLSRVVGRDVNLLHTNNVLLIYRERGGELKSRQIGLHAPPLRAWGFEFNACGTPTCSPSPYDLIVKDNQTGTKVVCRRCSWTSATLKIKDIDGILFRLSSTVPDVFWHEYPPSIQLQDVFVRITKQRPGRN